MPHQISLSEQPPKAEHETGRLDARDSGAERSDNATDDVEAAPANVPELLATLQHLLANVNALAPARGAILPFQFPSLQHLDDRMDRAIQRAREVDGLSLKSIRLYRAAYRRFRFFLRMTKGAEHAFLSGQASAQARVLEQWIAWMRGRGLNHTSVNTYWRSLHAPIARIAREDGVVTPTRLVAAPKPGAPFVQFLTKESLHDVFRFTRNYQWPAGEFERRRNISILATMALGGCRLGEVLRLQVEDVDVGSEFPVIRIKRSKGRRGGKSRIICIPPALAAALQSYLDVRASRHLATDRLFVSAHADLPLAEVTIRRLCRLITQKTGIKVAPHLLRHSCATLLRQAGVSDRISMEQLGHSSLGVLQKYSHVAPGERSAVIAKFNVALGDDDTNLAIDTFTVV